MGWLKKLGAVVVGVLCFVSGTDSVMTCERNQYRYRHREAVANANGVEVKYDNDVDAAVLYGDGKVRLQITNRNSAEGGIDLQSIIEYDNSGYLGEYTIAEHPLSLPLKIESVEGGDVWESGTYDGVLTTRYIITEQECTRGNTTVPPLGIKMDIEIRNYPYTSNESWLALLYHIDTENDRVETHDGVDMNSWYVKWESEYSYELPNGATGVEEVSSTLNSQELLFEFRTPQASAILWDPLVALHIDEASGGERAVPCLTRVYKHILHPTVMHHQHIREQMSFGGKI